MVEKTRGDPALLGAAMRSLYRPSTTVTYLATAMKANPDLKDHPQLRVILSATRQELGAQGTRKALPATPQQVAQVLKNTDKEVASTALTLYVTASRHGDLPHVTKYEWKPPTLTMGLRKFKSDRYGQRNTHKFVDVPRALWPWIPHKPPTTSYWKVLRAMKKVSRELTVHSLRRGAATHLAEAGFSMKEIGMLTAHTPTDDPSLGVRRYIDPTPTQPEGQLQRRMGFALGRAILGH